VLSSLSENAFLAPFIEMLWPHGVVLFALALGAALFKGWLKATKGRRHETLVHNAFARMGYRILTDVYLPESKGGVTQVDHLVACAAGLLVVETKAWAGVQYGGPNSRQWHRYLGRQKHSSQNPLHQNAKHIRAVKEFCPGIPVEGLVIFTDDSARLKDGWTSDVIHLNHLRRWLKASGMTSEPLSPTAERLMDRVAVLQTQRGYDLAVQHAHQHGYPEPKKPRPPKAPPPR